MNCRLLVCSFALHGAALTAAGAWMAGSALAPAAHKVAIAIRPDRPAPTPELLAETPSADPVRATARPLPEPPLPPEPTPPDDDFADLEPAPRPRQAPAERRRVRIGEAAFARLRVPEPTPPPEPPPEPPPAPEPPAAKIDAAVLDGCNEPPGYPALARRQHLEGSVLLRLRIGPNGDVERVTVHQSSGHGLLDRAAVAAVRTWRFSPARRGAESVADTIDQKIEFRLP